MPSPFPGMDPWLEQHWGDVHTSIVTYCRDRIQQSLPRNLRARVEERVVLEDQATGQGRNIIPDVSVVESRKARPLRDEGVVATLVPTEPIVVTVEDEPATERHIEIRDYSTGGTLVTVIEVLSPTNKLGPGRELYLQKQEEYYSARIHLVEIDLLRQGEPLERSARSRRPETANSPYFISVYRHSGGFVHYEMDPASMRARLPVIRIPLRPMDEDILLDVQQLIDDAYDRGGYDILNYNQPPKPTLSPADEAWVREWLKSHGAVVTTGG